MYLLAALRPYSIIPVYLDTYVHFFYFHSVVLSTIHSCASVRKNEREILVMHELNQFHATKFYGARSISFQHHLVTRQMRTAAAA